MKAFIGDYEGGSRKVEIEVHKHDLFSLDMTIAELVLPLLLKFRENIMGFPTTISKEDLPSELSSLEDDDRIKSWEWVLDEMIFAMDHISNGRHFSTYNSEVEERVDAGLLLFGKYFRDLWQ